jgi:sterol 3beta-glucosyltransferase
MMLPIRDILAIEKTRATRYGHYGLTVIIKGHEELFFEFGFEDRRNAFVTLLEKQMDAIQRPPAANEAQILSRGKRDALLLEEFEAKTSGSTDSDPRPAPEGMTDSLPAIMFTSASSTFLTFKPRVSLHFTFLTIGSRGDVQPYIALAKPLMADGHRVRIATHGEYKEWIESVGVITITFSRCLTTMRQHGIEYGYVGGDPAELMRICVENGTFTLSFMKEGLLKVFVIMGCVLTEPNI